MRNTTKEQLGYCAYELLQQIQRDYKYGQEEYKWLSEAMHNIFNFTHKMHKKNFKIK